MLSSKQKAHVRTQPGQREPGFQERARLSREANQSRPKYLPHLKSPVKPDAVRAFLAGIGLAEADVATAVVSCPGLLCSKVDGTLTPRIAQLSEIGLSPPPRSPA